MHIKVKRFNLRHNGKTYGPGAVIELADVDGKRLIEESRGSFEDVTSIA